MVYLKTLLQTRLERSWGFVKDIVKGVEKLETQTEENKQIRKSVSLKELMTAEVLRLHRSLALLLHKCMTADFNSKSATESYLSETSWLIQSLKWILILWILLCRQISARNCSGCFCWLLLKLQTSRPHIHHPVRKNYEGTNPQAPNFHRAKPRLPPSHVNIIILSNQITSLKSSLS